MREVMDAVTGALIALVSMVASLAGSLFFVALVARLAWHFRLWARTERRLLDGWLAFDLCVVVMAVAVGRMVSTILIGVMGLDPASYQQVAHGLVAAFAYLGPEGGRALFREYWPGPRSRAGRGE
ncbi:MAG: hypothetical protein P1U84_12245 [Parvibaculaceae bacterium]|nr:hypothetical protein [Parvibaculaceae bacterium]